MREVSFFKDKTEKCVIALGFFDAVHRGHVKVLDACVRLAKEKNVPAMAFTFECNPVEFVSGKDDKLVCTYKERIEKLMLGMEYAYIVRLPLEAQNRNELINKFYEKLKQHHITEIMERTSLEFSINVMKNSRYAKERPNWYSLYYIMK